MNPKSIIVSKASGIKDVYNPEKLRHSLSKSGAGDSLINNILQQVELQLYNGIPTKEIYKRAFALLKKHSGNLAGRYSLKHAILSLGPSGYPFEQYIGAIFAWLGYQVKMKQYMEGVCVTHEIDVVAENGQEVLLIECKYHNSQGIVGDVKLPLYIHSRYRDVQNKWNLQPGKKPLISWLVTNTKFSTDAIKYGNCAGLHLLGWNYPLHKSLANLADESHLYPVTALTTITKREKDYLLNAGIILCNELLKQQELLTQAAISNNRIPRIVNELLALTKG